MSSVETGQMSAVETGQMTAAETPVLSQQKTSVLSQQCPRLLLAAAGCPGPKVVKKHRAFVYLSSRPPIPFERGEGQCHQVSIFTTTSRTQAPRPDPRLSAGLLKSRQNPSVQALFGEKTMIAMLGSTGNICTACNLALGGSSSP